MTMAEPNDQADPQPPASAAYGQSPYPRLARAWDVTVMYVLPPVLLLGILISLLMEWPRRGAVDLTKKYGLEQTDRLAITLLGKEPGTGEIADKALISAIVEDMRIPKLPGTPCNCQPVATVDFRAGGRTLLSLGATRGYYWHDNVQYQWPRQFGPEFAKVLPIAVSTAPVTRIAPARGSP